MPSVPRYVCQPATESQARSAGFACARDDLERLVDQPRVGFAQSVGDFCEGHISLIDLLIPGDEHLGILRFAFACPRALPPFVGAEYAVHAWPELELEQTVTEQSAFGSVSGRRGWNVDSLLVDTTESRAYRGYINGLEAPQDRRFHGSLRMALELAFDI